MLVTTLNRYLVKNTLLGLLLSFTVISSLIVLVDYVEGTRKFSTNSDIDISYSIYFYLITYSSIIRRNSTIHSSLWHHGNTS